MIFNYKRVSTTDQNTERQLLDVVCDRAYIEKISGKNTDRPELQAMLLNIRAGDMVNVHSMDRLARNTKDLLNLVEEITGKGANIVFHKENLTFAPDKQDPYQKMMMTMLGAVAELERNLILERQREGIALAKMHGKYKGGQPKLEDFGLLFSSRNGFRYFISCLKPSSFFSITLYLIFVRSKSPLNILTLIFILHTSLITFCVLFPAVAVRAITFAFGNLLIKLPSFL